MDGADVDDVKRYLLAGLIVVAMVVLVVEPSRILGAYRDVTAAGTDEATPSGAGSSASPTTTATSRPDDWPTAPDDAGRGVVRRVSDGDTIRVDVVTGRPGDDVRTRLLRIDAPELARDGEPDECGAVRARDRLRELLPEGAVVALDWDVEPTDRYGRDLVHVWTADGTWVNGTMVVEGQAREVLFRPNDAHDDAIRAAEESARRAGRGLWDC